jgi:hypothetical protein
VWRPRDPTLRLEARSGSVYDLLRSGPVSAAKWQ